MTYAKHIITALLIAVLTGCAAGAVSTEEVQSLKQGMYENEVVQRIGKPIDINVTRTRHGERAQYVYNKTGYAHDRVYIYFEDGRLTTIQY